MPDDPPGPTTPREPERGGSDPGEPRFASGVEPASGSTTSQQPQVGAAVAAPAPGGGDLPYAQDDEPRRRRPEPRDEPRGGRYAKPQEPQRTKRVRARKVRRIVRHVEPWSVLKISVLFFLALFLIISVASVVLWGAARSAGTVDDVESFVTSVGGFGNCEPIDGEEPTTPTTTAPGATTTAPVDQLDPDGGDDTVAPDPPAAVDPGDDEDCPEGQELVGEFRFEDGRILQAFALGGVVLVLAGAATAVVLTLLFNLISDLTGGVRVTVLEEDPPPRPRAGSPGSGSRG